MKAAWVNDIHLEYLITESLDAYLKTISETDADCLLIGGDTAHATDIGEYLSLIENGFKRPVYFVLGNHDYYRGSIEQVRESIMHLSSNSKRLNYLSASGVIPLTKRTALIGHGCWGDGRLGNYQDSYVDLNDFYHIKELSNLSSVEKLKAIKNLGAEAAGHFQKVLPAALKIAEHIVVLTHVPPFTESTWHEGRYSDQYWLPFFACGAVGDVLKKIMLQHPSKTMTVLCGHTHGGGMSQITKNIISYTGEAQYGNSIIQRIFEWE